MLRQLFVVLQYSHLIWIDWAQLPDTTLTALVQIWSLILSVDALYSRRNNSFVRTGISHCHLEGQSARCEREGETLKYHFNGRKFLACHEVVDSHGWGEKSASDLLILLLNHSLAWIYCMLFLCAKFSPLLKHDCMNPSLSLSN